MPINPKGDPMFDDDALDSQVQVPDVQSETVDDDDDGDELEIGAAPSRQEKKANRYREAQEEARRAREEANAIRGELEQVKGYLAGMAQNQQRQQQTQEDPLESSLNELQEQQDALQSEYRAVAQRYAALGQEVPKDQYNAMIARGRKIDEKRSELYAEKAIRRAMPDQQRLQLEMRAQQLAQENADVYGNERALLWSRGRFAQLVASGEQDNRQLHDRVMEEARRQFNMKPQREENRISPQARQHLSGVGRGSVASGERRTYTMTKSDKELADTMYSYEKDSRVRYQRYVNEVVKKR